LSALVRSATGAEPREIEMHEKMLDLVVNQPAGTLFSDTAQILVALGLVCFLLLWGTAKIIKARRK
jgi:hypothetical protein